VQQVEATVIGMMASADMEKFEGGGFPGTEYAIKSVTKYVLRIAGDEIARFDILQGGWLDAGGQQAQIASITGLNV
jgi:hypothetical protein